MKKFTIIWQWMMILLLSSSVLVIQAQKNAAADKVPVNKELNDEQIKLLEEAGILILDSKAETLTDEEFYSAEKLLKDLKGENASNPVVLESSSYVEKIYNSKNSVTVTLGTGTATNTTTGTPTPYGTFYKNFRQQYLILASELIPLGIGLGDITAWGFNVAALNTCVDMPNYTISMKHTTVTALTTTLDNDGLITVFTLPTFLPIVGWNTHTFDTPFTWDGTSNLLIDICTTLIPGAYTQNASVYFTPTTGTNTCARYQSDTQPACLSTALGTVSANRANMQITGEEMLNPPPGMPYNEVPINGSSDVAIDGDITWTFGNNTDTYDLWFGPAGNLVKVVDNQPAGATGTYTYTGLSYATSYQWQVAATNANGTTNGPFWNFSTTCGSITAFPWIEGFEGATIPALPSCWFEENGDWATTNNASSTFDADAYTGTQFLRDSWNATNEYVWTPGFSLEAGIPYDFSFWWAGDNYAGWTGDVFYNTTQNSVGATQLGTSFVEAGTTTTKIYAQVTNTFAPAEAGTYYFAIRVNCPSSAPWYLSFDDFRFEPSPSCPQPMTLGATYISATSADLTWISFSGLSDIEFGPAGFPPTGVPTYTGVTSPYTVTGLTAVTSYSFYVRDDCGSGDYSYWSGPYTFTTQPSCPQPFDLGAANVTMTSADLIWISFSSLSDVEFGPGGFTPTGAPTYAGITSPYNVSGLNSASPYDFYVRDDCGGGDYSFWSGPFTLLTSPGSQTLPVWEDFENGFVYFNNAAGNGADWTINNTYYHSGAQCAHNSYNNTQTNILHETGVLDLSAAAVVWLDFWQIAKTEGNYDHCIIEISTDGGLNYTPLPLETYTGSGNYHVPTANAPYDICFDEDSYAIWGTGSEIPDNATWWQHETFDLSNYLTTNVRLRFRLHTDGSVLRYGWLVDEILIFEPAYGTLSGTVTDAAGSNPIEGASVTVGYLSATSGVDGTYSITGVLTGTWNATCTKEGFNPITVPVTIIEDQTTTQDFSLTAPQIVVNPLVVDVVLEPNAQTDELVNISNPGNGPLDWDASLVLMGDSGKDPWDLQISFDVTAATGAAGNAGAECDGEFYYTTRWASSLIHKYDLSGNLIEEFSIPGVTGLRDLAYDGTYFYGGAAANTIFKMDFINKVLISTISSPQPVRSIAYDEGQNGLWVANWATDIVLIDMSGTTLATLPASVHMLAGIYGTAYDNWTTGGPYLWIFDQGAGTGTPQMLYQANLSSLTMTGFTHDVTADLPANPDAIAGGLFTIPNIFAGTVSLGGLIQGVPDMFFVYELAPYSTWLTISPTSGILSAGTNEDMTLHFDATDLLPGVYQAEIHFGTNPNVGSPVVNVSMTVEGLIPATNLALSHSCTDVELTWDMPTGGSPDSWNIYKDGVLIGNSTVMEHTDAMVMPNVLISYFVKAVYAGEESMPSATESITVPVPGSLQPIGLSAVANTPNIYYVTLDWNEPNACLEPEGYNVYRDNIQISTALVTDLTYIDGPLTSGLYEYKLKAVYYFGESGFSTPAYALVPVGIEETGDDTFRIYPNPASNMVTIESTKEITEIKIFNNSGQIVIAEKINGLSYQIDVSQYEKGVYYISLETGTDKLLRKITIN